MFFCFASIVPAVFFNRSLLDLEIINFFRSTLETLKHGNIKELQGLQYQVFLLPSDYNLCN